jgi:hypothetical protein
MSHARRHRAPRLEPELLEYGLGSASLGGATLSPEHGGHVSGAFALEPAGAITHAAVNITLSDGSHVTFARFVDLPSLADA